MVVIKSQRAKTLLQSPRAIIEANPSKMRKYPHPNWDLWVEIEREGQIVKNLSFAGELEDYQKVLLEALAALMKNKAMTSFDHLSLRECEAYLRDRNSEFAVEDLALEEEEKFKKLFLWMRVFPTATHAQEYHFSLHKGPFRALKLVEKVRELKAFLNSVEIQELYQGVLPPELIDVEDLTVYIQVPYYSDRDKALFEELHVQGVSTFQEESLNFIPEA